MSLAETTLTAPLVPAPVTVLLKVTPAVLDVRFTVPAIIAPPLFVNAPFDVRLNVPQPPVPFPACDAPLILHVPLAAMYTFWLSPCAFAVRSVTVTLNGLPLVLAIERLDEAETLLVRKEKIKFHNRRR